MWIFSSNDIKIELPKYIFSPGEIVSGKVITSISEPQKASSITLSFYGEMIQRRKRTSTVGGQTRTDEYDDRTVISEQNVILAWEWVYDSMEYPFSFQIPEDVFPVVENTDAPDIPGLPSWANTGIDILIDAASRANMPGASLLGWASYRFYLVSRIDIPWAIDITSKQEITVNRFTPQNVNKAPEWNI
jgi:Arrestin (or S-antigen), N-terminal domain